MPKPNRDGAVSRPYLSTTYPCDARHGEDLPGFS